jgi:GntR family transcriptional regulator
MIQIEYSHLRDIKLDFRSKIPLSDQVREAIRQLILREVLRPGNSLPTVRSLASQLNVNFNTIARAYRALDQEGWIYTHQGRGTQVAERTEIRPGHIQLAQENYLKTLVEQTISLAEQAGLSAHDLREEIERQLPQTKRPRIRNLSRRMILHKTRSILAMKRKKNAQRTLKQKDALPQKKTKTPQKTRRS